MSCNNKMSQKDIADPNHYKKRILRMHFTSPAPPIPTCSDKNQGPQIDDKMMTRPTIIISTHQNDEKLYGQIQKSSKRPSMLSSYLKQSSRYNKRYPPPKVSIEGNYIIIESELKIVNSLQQNGDSVVKLPNLRMALTAATRAGCGRRILRVPRGRLVYEPGSHRLRWYLVAAARTFSPPMRFAIDNGEKPEFLQMLLPVAVKQLLPQQNTPITIEEYVKEMTLVERWIPQDFYQLYKYVTGYQICCCNQHPISFLTFLMLYNKFGLQYIIDKFILVRKFNGNHQQ